ncbi:hypothetical protein PTSG_09715 [Salpingoeca rosetta]|uniref:Cytochrome b561 domain-containing protein n=1 Tax=Salpingoeca rosetta (strain ATCC 50818 / BSB-021) TaxID=946362 RepID=F2UNU4_SALR5|nr:uncharacterized protein PTSG_09715 [Salpingoeca rosetta]EGD79299.1 hypothetical protein PTSG_09715 [Salpingoeca rosetta]|eukprot:XP_004989070.1 hypothetical protein PTSG_09715 [Salpingoeca rosetta]
MASSSVRKDNQPHRTASSNQNNNNTTAKMSDWSTAGLFMGTIAAAALLTVLELYYVGVGTRGRQVYNAVFVRLLYVGYFVVLGFLIHWMPQGFHGAGGASISFNFHPLFMSIAWAFCATEAAMSFRSPGSWGHKGRKTYHALMNFLSFSFSVSGIAIVFINHQQKKEKHMASQHSWLGFGTATLMCLQLLLGAFAFYWSRNEAWKKRMVLFHRFLGAATHVSALATISMGLANNYGIPLNDLADPYNVWWRVNKTATILLWSIAIRVLAGFGGAPSSPGRSVNAEKRHLLQDHYN